MKLKSLVISFALSLGVILGAKGASTSMVLLAGGFTNFPSIKGPLKISKIIVSASSTNVANLQFVDTITNSTTNVVGAYTNYSQYATNIVTTWTNYYGAVNNSTNMALVTTTNGYAGATNNYNIPFACIVNTNGTVSFDNATYPFVFGCWVTNAVAPGSGPAVITAVYTQ